MKTLLIIMAFLFSTMAADASAGWGNKRPRRNGVTKKVVWQGEKKYKKTRYKPVTVTSKMFAGENIRKWGASSKF